MRIFLKMNMIGIITLPMGKLSQHELKQFIRATDEAWYPLDGSVAVSGTEAWRDKSWSPGLHQRGLKQKEGCWESWWHVWLYSSQKREQKCGHKHIKWGRQEEWGWVSMEEGKKMSGERTQEEGIMNTPGKPCRPAPCWGRSAEPMV